jgi:hypothetical protein
LIHGARARAARSATAAKRLGFFYVPNGMYLPISIPRLSGLALVHTGAKPLESFRQHERGGGLSNLGVISPNEGGSVHTRARRLVERRAA